jgi:hypothetical protein
MDWTFIIYMEWTKLFPLYTFSNYTGNEKRLVRIMSSSTRGLKQNSAKTANANNAMETTGSTHASPCLQNSNLLWWIAKNFQRRVNETNKIKRPYYLNDDTEQAVSWLCLQYLTPMIAQPREISHHIFIVNNKWDSWWLTSSINELPIYNLGSDMSSCLWLPLRNTF